MDYRGATALAGDLAPRTLADYHDAVVPLTAYFGPMTPTSVGPPHISKYLDLGVQLEIRITPEIDEYCAGPPATARRSPA